MAASNQVGVKEFKYNESTFSSDYSFWRATVKSYFKISFLDYKNNSDDNLYAGSCLIQCCGDHILKTLAAARSSRMGRLIVYWNRKNIRCEIFGK